MFQCYEDFKNGSVRYESGVGVILGEIRGKGRPSIPEMDIVFPNKEHPLRLMKYIGQASYTGPVTVVRFMPDYYGSDETRSTDFYPLAPEPETFDPPGSCTLNCGKSNVWAGHYDKLSVPEPEKTRDFHIEVFHCEDMRLNPFIAPYSGWLHFPDKSKLGDALSWLMFSDSAAVPRSDPFIDVDDGIGKIPISRNPAGSHCPRNNVGKRLLNLIESKAQ